MLPFIDFFILANALANIDYAKRQSPKYQKRNELMKLAEIERQQKMIALLEKLVEKNE